jgi:bifunctional non-homologous end joining protein LigD
MLRLTQEFVVGGWTEPRGGRKHFGALLLGTHSDEGKLLHAGQVGSGFTSEMLRTLHTRLVRLERKTSPFSEAVRASTSAHWVTPRLVVQVEFNEWTEGGKVRQASYQGLRADKDPAEVIREPAALIEADAVPDTERESLPETEYAPEAAPPPDLLESLMGRMDALCAEGGGTLHLPNGRVQLTNLKKVYFPGRGKQARITKGELLRYYLEMSPTILPWMEGRPLVLRRFPGGIRGEAFYQQTAPDNAPDGVRVEVIVGEDGEEQSRLVGGSLSTLLYTVQLGAISYDPWHSRIGGLASADYTILDLDPGEKTSFRTVVEVARLIRDEMDTLGLHGGVKTSGATGLHIFLPLAAGTPLESARLLAELVATRVAHRAPRIATVVRAVRKRPGGTVYVDYLQNIQGKTVAGVYAARPRPTATVSTPLAWEELDDDLDPRSFTIRTVPGRVRRMGDLWTPAMERPNRLEVLFDSPGGA